MLPPVGNTWKGAEERLVFMTSAVHNFNSIVMDQRLFPNAQTQMTLACCNVSCCFSIQPPNHLKTFQTAAMSISAFIIPRWVTIYTNVIFTGH